MLLYLSFSFVLSKWKKTEFLDVVCVGKGKTKWKCRCAEMTWRVRWMDGGREVHKPSG